MTSTHRPTDRELRAMIRAMLREELAATLPRDAIWMLELEGEPALRIPVRFLHSHRTAPALGPK